MNTAPPIPAPPVAIKEPVVVEVDAALLEVLMIPPALIAPVKPIPALVPERTRVPVDVEVD